MDDSLKKTVPFKAVFNLRLLIRYWQETLKTHKIPAIAKSILKSIEDAPELNEDVVSDEIIERHRPLIDFLLTAAIPAANNDTELVAATLPFQFKAIYITPAFHRAIDYNRIEEIVKINVPDSMMATGKVVHACMIILQKFYNIEFNLDRPILLSTQDPATGLEKVYKLEINHQFCEVISTRTPKPIDKNVINFLMEKLYDVDLWLQYLRPQDYEFHGFMVLRLVDVTEQEMLSSIKYDLLEKDAVLKQESFRVIQQKLRSIFGIPEMQIGLAYLDPNDKLILNSGSESCWKSLSEVALDQCSFDGSIYERSWQEQRHVTIEDLSTYQSKTVIEKSLVESGIRNILLAPLIDDGQTIGMLELATNDPGRINPLNASKIENVLPMFSVAVKRVRDDMNTEVRALIQEECTAIHPTVQWRFLEAGTNVLNKRRMGIKADLEEIVFREVYPLFGMVDIRNSSLERNKAIQQDLQYNLKLAKTILLEIKEKKGLLIVEELNYRIEHQEEIIQYGLASGDENNVLDLLRHEVNPVIKSFTNDPVLKKSVKAYFDELEPEFSVVYKKRKSFEESVTQINKAISSLLDDGQKSAQQMFPHYFEKYQTDGSEFTLYLGSSLVKNRTFDPFYLSNFRLWQLVLLCEINRRIEELKPTLSIPLDITSLVLIHDYPISIRFRPDEKQFDVDGAYDIRYEIVKKRIDKAFIKGTNERLTQPGKIAIVYNQTKAEQEYQRYFRYLANKGLIESEVESLELEELPGANGLHAFRITLINDSSTDRNMLREIEEALVIPKS